MTQTNLIGKLLVIDPITDATETATSAVVRNMETGEETTITDAAEIRALYDHPSAESYGEGSYTVTLTHKEVTAEPMKQTVDRQATLTEAIKAEVAEILKTGNSAPKLYLRVRPNGTVDVAEETSWCCSPDEYYKRVPHTLSLEVLASTRDYSSLSVDEIEECADNAEEGAETILEGWRHDIDEWIAAGNLEGVEAEAR